MKLFHWVFVALLLAVPYDNQGIVAACIGAGRTSVGQAALASPAVEAACGSRPVAGHAPLAQQTSAKLRYRSAFFVAVFSPPALVPTFCALSKGHDQAFFQLSRDIFHPPA